MSLDEIDIMHEIDHHVHRFEPENMKVLPKEEKQLPMITLSYQSKKCNTIDR